MDWRRTVLYMALAFVVISLWQSWQKEHPSKRAAAAGPALIAPTSQVVAPGLSVTSAALAAPSRVITVQTDVLSLKIDLKQGEIIEAKLPAYPQSEHNQTPYTLLNHTGAQRYQVGSQLASLDTQNHLSVNDFHFQAAQSTYHLSPTQQTLIISLEGQSDQGLKVTKTFTLKRGDYLIEERYTLHNQGTQAWSGRILSQLTRQSPPAASSSLLPGAAVTYTGASYSEPGVHRYQKVSFDDMAKQNLSVKAKGGWVAMQEHYFLTAWIQDDNETATFYTRAANDVYTMGVLGELIQVNPDQTLQTTAKLYIGPEIRDVLHRISPTLSLTIDYGIFWLISEALLSVMQWIYQWVGNWGVSIILITMLLKLVFYRFSASSYRSMANMRNIQPKLQALRDRYGEDKAKLSQATMDLYRQEKVNPLGGCLPLLIQVPVFFALYWLLIESVELRQAPFVGWVTDLSAPDIYHVFPVLMGLTMVIQQKLNPTPPDPMQAKMMMALPIVFAGMLWSSPSGLVLYWIVNNVLSIGQQWWITRRYS